MLVDLQVQTYSTQQLRESQRQNIIALCNRAFEGRESFEPLFTFVQDGIHVLGFLDGSPVSHAVVTPRWMRINDGPQLRCAYVDAVATEPAQWRKGYGAAVMRQLALEMAAQDYDIGGLSTATPSFYESTGWEQWRGPLAGWEGDRIIPTAEEDPVMVLRLPGTPPFDRFTDQLSIQKQPGRIW